MPPVRITVFQKGWNYSQDGPGNRLVYHLQGCNMACPWCANPEGMPDRPPLMAVKEPLPDAICPYGAVKGGVLDRSHCRACEDRACVTVHKNDALVCWGSDVPVEKLVDEAVRSRAMFFDGGGVTLTGGEPTRQYGGVQAMLGRLKAEGISTAMETNGTHPGLPALFPLIDTLLLDFKHPDNAVHKAFTGVGNEAVRQNIRRAAESHPHVQLRVPMINGFNVGESELEGFLSFFKEIKASGPLCGIVTLEFLRYHEFGRQKWAQCGRKYRMENGQVPAGWVKRYEAAFRQAGFTVVHT